MKKLLVMIAVVAVVGFMAVSAQAAVMTDTINVNQMIDNDWMTPISDTAEWTHNVSSLSPAVINDADLYITFGDDYFDFGQMPWYEPSFADEWVKVKLDNGSWSGTFEVNNGTMYSKNDLSLLLQDYMLKVTVRCTDGDLFINQSNLVIDYTSPTTVPEPASMALLGLGLLGVFARRKK